MVRQFEETRRTHLAVALAADPAEYGTADEFELAVSVAASLGAQAFREERPVSVCVGPAALGGGTGRRLLDAFAGVATADRGRPRDGRAGRRHRGAQRIGGGAGVRTEPGRPDHPPGRHRVRHRNPGGMRADRGGRDREMSSIGGVDVATVGSLEDLPRALHRMRAA